MICCATCQRPFNSPDSLLQHMITFQDAPTHTSLPVLWLPTLAALAEQIDSSSTESSDAEPLMTPSTSSSSSYTPFKALSCHICGKSFDTQQGIAAHLRHAPNHSPSFSCKECTRKFYTQDAMKDHQKATGHTYTTYFTCKPCNRQFKTAEALAMHTRSAPAHNISYKCQPCNRTFSSQAALEAHTKEAKAHKLPLSCKSCPRVFNSQTALNDHMRDSHPPPLLTCPRCTRRFKDIEALKQHLRDAPIHKTESEPSPLDAFFTSFPGFRYDPLISPAESFERLVSYNEWEEGSPDGEDAWVIWQEAMGEEIRLWAEMEYDLAKWVAICRVLGVDPLPRSCMEAKREIMKKFTLVVEMAVGFAKQRR